MSCHILNSVCRIGGSFGWGNSITPVFPPFYFPHPNGFGFGQFDEHCLIWQLTLNFISEISTTDCAATRPSFFCCSVAMLRYDGYYDGYDGYCGYDGYDAAKGLGTMGTGTMLAKRLGYDVYGYDTDPLKY